MVRSELFQSYDEKPNMQLEVWKYLAYRARRTIIAGFFLLPPNLVSDHDFITQGLYADPDSKDLVGDKYTLHV